MNGINRRGMKVVCVVAMELESQRTGAVVSGPEVDKVYTVLDFIDNSGMMFSGELSDDGIDLNCAIDLYEFRALKTKCGRLVGWPIGIFRPAVDRETDIGIFTGILARQTEPA